MHLLTDQEEKGVMLRNQEEMKAGGSTQGAWEREIGVTGKGKITGVDGKRR